MQKILHSLLIISNKVNEKEFLNFTELSLTWKWWMYMHAPSCKWCQELFITKWAVKKDISSLPTSTILENVTIVYGKCDFTPA